MMMTIKTGPIIILWGSALCVTNEFGSGGSFSLKLEIMNFELNFHLFVVVANY